MSDKHHNPQPHQSPVHDDREAKPGLDALAPEDQNWRPTPHPTAPGEEPTAPGSMKAPDTHSEKLDALEKQRKGGEDLRLPPIRAYASQTTRTRCARANAAPRCWKILSCAKKSPILTTSAFLRGSSMPAAPLRTAISRRTAT